MKDTILKDDLHTLRDQVRLLIVLSAGRTCILTLICIGMTYTKLVTVALMTCTRRHLLVSVYHPIDLKSRLIDGSLCEECGIVHARKLNTQGQLQYMDVNMTVMNWNG